MIMLGGIAATAAVSALLAGILLLGTGSAYAAGVPFLLGGVALYLLVRGKDGAGSARGLVAAVLAALFLATTGQTVLDWRASEDRLVERSAARHVQEVEDPDTALWRQKLEIRQDALRRARVALRRDGY